MIQGARGEQGLTITIVIDSQCPRPMVAMDTHPNHVMDKYIACDLVQTTNNYDLKIRSHTMRPT